MPSHDFFTEANLYASMRDKIPEGLQGGIVRFMLHGIQPGRFLEAVFSNDLFGAYKYADETSAANLHNVVLWLYENAPAIAVGGKERMRAWMASGGYHGKERSNGNA